ncbi:MAG: ABC transporter ATP-binding protein [Rhodospirillales bacterium]|nr:ABC transporter ATP-binding protein [Rhodospirillales bacterium]
MTRLKLDKVVKRFGAVTAVDEVSIDIAAGEFVTLLGASGCGKTTLLRLVAGFAALDSGAIALEGQDVAGLPPACRNIGFVFQSYALFPHMTVAGNIGFALRLRRRPRAEIADRVAQLVAMVHLEGLEARYPHELSGGQQQRVALARALAPAPPLLLLDEPLSALDAKIRAALRAEIRAVVKRTGVTALYVTHDQDEALSMSDRIVVMDQGRFVQVGAPIELYARPANRFVANFLGTSNLLIGEAAGDGRLVIERHAVDLALPTALAGRKRVLVCVRPEHVSLEPVLGSVNGTPILTILDSAFLGQTVRVTGRLASGAPLAVDLPAERWQTLALAPGDRALWTIDPRHAILLPDAVDMAEEG